MIGTKGPQMTNQGRPTLWLGDSPSSSWFKVEMEETGENLTVEYGASAEEQAPASRFSLHRGDAGVVVTLVDREGLVALPARMILRR